MRIAYMVTTLARGGAERLVLALAGQMRARGHAVKVVLLKHPAAEDLPTDLDSLSLGMEKRLLKVLAGLAQARRSLSAFRPDVVHSHTFPANMAARLLRASGLRAAVITTIHNVYEGGGGRMLAYRMTDRLSRLNVAVCQAARDRFVRLKAVPAGKTRVISNGIDTQEFAPCAERRRQVREQLQAGESFVWLAAGRIVPAKDYPNLLRGFARLRQAQPGARLWVAGAGSADRLAELQRLAESLGVADTVRWLGVRGDLPALLDAADGFVLASAWEGMPLAAAEAMAMQKPVVATDVGGVHELLGETGFLTPAGSPERLAEAMNQVQLRSEAERLELGAAARSRVLAEFDMERKADSWEAAYREVTNEP